MNKKIWITLISCIAYCINRELYKGIDYLKTQVKVLIENQEKQNKRIVLTDKQRRRLASKGKRLSRKMLEQCTVLFTPYTIMRWYNKLVAAKYDGSKRHKSPGHPQITPEIVKLVIKIKKENLRWGYKKIRNQVVYLGYKICKTSVKNILIENGYDPEPNLTVRSTWHEFLSSHWDVLTACDFFTIELLIGRKLVRCTVFFVIELATRKVFFTPLKPQPDGAYMKQVARLLTEYGGFLDGKRFLIHDRDPLYNTAGFHDILNSSGIEPVKLPPHSPDLNCYAERFVKTIKTECLDHLILSSVEQLEYAIEEFVKYYHHERIHQSLGRIIEPKHEMDDDAEIKCIKRLGGLLKSYHRLAA